MPYTTVFIAVELMSIRLSGGSIPLSTTLYFSFLVSTIRGSSIIIEGLAICLVG